MKNLKGKYREPAVGEAPAQVYVAYGKFGFPVSEVYYQVCEFEPALVAVPWKEDYVKPPG